MSKKFWVDTISPNISKKLWRPSESHKGPLLYNSEHHEQFFHFWDHTDSSRAAKYFSTNEWKPIVHPTKRIISRKIRVYPNHQQKRIFKNCFDAHRYFYNKAVKILNHHFGDLKRKLEKHNNCAFCKKPKSSSDVFTCLKHTNKKINWVNGITLPDLRDLIFPKRITVKNVWQRSIPCNTKVMAIKDAITAYKSCTSNLNNGNIKDFTMGFKSRKNPSQIFWIDSRAINTENRKLRIFSTKIKKPIYTRKRQRNKLPPMMRTNSGQKCIEHDAKIQYDRGAYYFIFSLTKDAIEPVQPKYSIVSLDPGVRTFQTCYSPSGIAFKTSVEQQNTLKELNAKLEQLISARDQSTNPVQYRRRRKKCLKVERKKSNIAGNIRNQLGTYLTQNYGTILIPEFSTSQLQRNPDLSSITKKTMTDMSHYKFRMKLADLCKRDGRELQIVEEHYTSQTCGKCGATKKIGKDAVYTCNKCSYIMDRDMNGARNILLKYITEHKELFPSIAGK